MTDGDVLGSIIPFVEDVSDGSGNLYPRDGSRTRGDGGIVPTPRS